MNEQERQAKGIWIPIDVWKNKDLSWNEKILLLEIDSFTSKDKDCYISNEYISNLLGVSETNANKILSSLIKKGYVVKTSFDGRRRFVKSALIYTTTQPCQERQPCLDDCDNIPNIYTDNNIPIKESTKVDKKEEDKIDYDYILKQWNNICPTFTQPRMLNDKRKRQINTLLKNNNANIEDLIKCFKIIASSSVCNGKDNERGWKATFDWLINDTKNCFNGLLEGKYSFKGNDKNIYQNIIKGIDNVKQQPKKVEWQ